MNSEQTQYLLRKTSDKFVEVMWGWLTSNFLVLGIVGNEDNGERPEQGMCHKFWDFDFVLSLI